LDATTVSGLFISPVRNIGTTGRQNILAYNSTTSEITYQPSPLDNIFLDTTTTGTTTLSLGVNSNQTYVSTPSTSGRIYVLQQSTNTTYNNYWFAICNTSTSNTIAVQSPSGTTIGTIPVAPTTAGITQKFVNYYSSGAAGNYYRVV